MDSMQLIDIEGRGSWVQRNLPIFRQSADVSALQTQNKVGKVPKVPPIQVDEVSRRHHDCQFAHSCRSVRSQVD
jgi:hypothetical protein